MMPGANDDASGTTAVLELAHALAAGPPLKRGILFVCYGSEELGGLGSRYFGEHPPIPLNSIVANLELEMIGAQDPKLPTGYLMMTGFDRSDFGQMLRSKGALVRRTRTRSFISSSARTITRLRSRASSRTPSAAGRSCRPIISRRIRSATSTSLT